MFLPLCYWHCNFFFKIFKHFLLPVSELLSSRPWGFDSGAGTSVESLNGHLVSSFACTADGIDLAKRRRPFHSMLHLSHGCVFYFSSRNLLIVPFFLLVQVEHKSLHRLFVTTAHYFLEFCLDELVDDVLLRLLHIIFSLIVDEVRWFIICCTFSHPVIESL